MPPPLSRFTSGPTAISAYHQQFPSHGQSHPGHQPPLGGTPSYLAASAQINPFPNPTNNGLVASGINGGFNTSMDGPRLGFQSNFPSQHNQPQHMAIDYQQPNVRSQTNNKGRIREVWKHNLHEEMAVLRSMVEKYPYIAMDTEFPGIVARPMGRFKGKSDYHYQCLRTNVDMLNIIQIGITLFNEEGETPPARPTPEDSVDLGLAGRKSDRTPLPYSWQFNFKFSLKDEMYNEKSIESLQSASIDFSALERDGIDPHEFASLLIPSGLVCFDDVHWISFHGGYDFGYLTKILTCSELPGDEEQFIDTMRRYFPSIYDVKHLMKHAIKTHNLGIPSSSDPAVIDLLQKFEHKSGLENLAESMRIKRVGLAHQAGSDSLLTGKVFWIMKERVYNGEIPADQVGKVWGLGYPDGVLTGHIVAGLNATDSVQTSAQGTNGISNAQNGGPTTPSTSTVGLASTPAGQSQGINSLSMGPMTPGGGGGVFGNFAFSSTVR